MDVDCSKFTYDTPASSLIQTAAEKAQREMNEMPLIGEGVVLDRTETQEEVLSRSLLKHIDEKTASEDDILEAYCRDVDAYSFDLNDAQQQAQQQNNLALGAPRAQQTPMVGLLNISKTCFPCFVRSWTLTDLLPASQCPGQPVLWSMMRRTVLVAGN